LKSADDDEDDEDNYVDDVDDDDMTHDCALTEVVQHGGYID